MKLITKINLIKKFRLTPDQILFLEKINLLFDFEDELSNEKIELFIDVLNKKLDELQEIEDVEYSLNLAYIISITEQNMLNLQLSFDDEEEYKTDDFIEAEELEESENIEDDEFLDEIGGLSAKDQRRLQKEAVVKYKELDKNSIVSEFRSYVLRKYPQILNGFDRSIYSNAKIAYWKKEHIFDLWQIPTKVYEKIKDAEYEVEEKLKEDVQKNAEKMFLTWYKDYKVWLDRNRLKKSTKVNIKDFFRAIKVKPSETMVERIKEAYSSEEDNNPNGPGL